MKFVIFADKNHDFIKPIAEGLAKMLKNEQQQCVIYYGGRHWLLQQNIIKEFFADIAKFFANLKARKKNLYVYRFWQSVTFMNRKRKRELQQCDCIILVLHCPGSFYFNLQRIEQLRRRFNKPVVNYDLHFMPNQGWYKKIKQQNVSNYGLERYDWYLPASLVSEYALPKEIPQIYSHVGFDVKSPSLYPEQKEFTALIDFERKGYEAERAIQIQALKETNTPYVELKGRYTADDIRSIYRRCGMYFPAFRESFGLPILELQLCGCTIFTPFREWVPAHFLNKSVNVKGNGDPGSNFFVYNNDIEKLKSMIINLKEHYNPQTVIDRFKTEYPFYYSYNKEEMKSFLQKLQNKEISPDSHLKYEQYNRFISTEDDVWLYES
ncbi:MAG: hypothetical protein LBD53_08835 [Tannerella sp.]|jgi:hypothetical protein|nr:hypothetical protein [Tannerella sp.]